ncbi:MAG: S41 family peptidase [Leptospiraceae bacterium]|nr:S41 family peptidase [Leptospiraceae bacterium]MCP5494152.1 S41 family peptidase [Leptospiraceae bacterium]
MLLFTICTIFVFTTVAYCEPSTKKASKNTADFTAKDFESVVVSVKRYYIDKHIDVNMAYTDAAAFALMSLPHSLYIYPESYFLERDKFEEEEDVKPGKTFKLSTDDRFLIFDPDYKKIEEEKKKKAKPEDFDKKANNEKIKKMVEREKIRKEILYSRWKQINFGKKEFERIIAFIEKNLNKYKEPPIDEKIVEDEDDPKEDFSIKDIYLAAANGYLNSLDPHSNVFLKEVWEESMAKIQDGSFEGIGAILSGGGNRDVLVENPLEDRPAVKAGIRAGDIIEAVDGKPTKGMSLEKVVKRIKGKKGTIVRLTISRKGTSGTFDINVTRATIVIKNVTHRLIKDHKHIGYIKLTGFVKSYQESSDREIQKAFYKLEEAAKKNKTPLKALILDLRNNAGGYLDLAIDISDMFIKRGLIVSTRGPNRSPEEAWAKNPDLTDLPLAVLINAKSASASEIVASAIKYHGRGLLLGERTFGKATVQKLMDLPGNSQYVLKITQARYYSPSGQTIQVVGVEPDIEISAEDDGSFPFQFREENMWHHLPKIPAEVNNYRPKYDIEKLNSWVQGNGKAEAFLNKHKDDPIKPDYQLIRAVDYVEAMIASLK